MRESTSFLLGNYPSTAMIFKMISPLLVFSLLHASTSVLEIATFQREGNTVQLQCREEQFNGQPPTQLRNVSLFLFNSTGQSVTSLLVENNIDYDFDARGVLSFEVQQSIEGYYYCSRNKSAGFPDDEDDYRTILGKCFWMMDCISLNSVATLQTALFRPAEVSNVKIMSIIYNNAMYLHNL